MQTFSLPEDNIFYKISLDWKTPLIAIALYLVMAIGWSKYNIRNGMSKTPIATSDNLFFRSLIVLHNGILCLFSLATFCSIFPILYKNFTSDCLFGSFCDVKGWGWEAGVGFWTWLFYLSKYYEIFDTIILLLKGRPSSFLQTYHHAGAIFSMWMMCNSHAYGSWVFVIFNSFIHTFMYFYYVLTSLQYRPRWKSLMTYMQIAQFLLGLPMALIYIVLPNCIQKKAHVDDVIAKVFALNAHQSQSLAFAFTFSYVSYLVVLFFEFARRNYGSKAGAAGKTKKTNAEKLKAEIPKKSGAKQQRGRKSVAPKEKATVAAKKSAPSKSRGRKPKVVVATSPSPARVSRAAAATTTKKSPIRRKSAMKANEAIKRK